MGEKVRVSRKRGRQRRTFDTIFQDGTTALNDEATGLIGRAWSVGGGDFCEVGSVAARFARISQFISGMWQARTRGQPADRGRQEG